MDGDLTLIISILTQVEKHLSRSSGGPIELVLPNWSDEVVQKHLVLLQETGQLICLRSAGGKMTPMSLGPRGQSYLDQLRNDIQANISLVADRLLDRLHSRSEDKSEPDSRPGKATG